jgi:hypothetical protein
MATQSHTPATATMIVCPNIVYLMGAIAQGAKIAHLRTGDLKNFRPTI